MHFRQIGGGWSGPVCWSDNPGASSNSTLPLALVLLSEAIQLLPTNLADNPLLGMSTAMPHSTAASSTVIELSSISTLLLMAVQVGTAESMSTIWLSRCIQGVDPCVGIGN